MQAPLPYMNVLPVDAWPVDRGHLKTLAICHYVWGGLQILFSLLGIFYIVLGLVFVNDPGALGAQAVGPPGRPPPPPMPAFFGWMFVGMGACVVVLGWTTGILTILSGRGLARVRGRTFSIVMAAINCISFPIGTTLGVFTFIVLLRPSVAALYANEQQEAAAATAAARSHGAAAGA
jgi:hypothetical protein